MSRSAEHAPPRGVGRWAPAALVIPVVCVLAWQAAHPAPRSAAAAGSAYREPGWAPLEKSNRWTCIVIHHSASEVGGAERFGQWHRDKGWDELGYHFVIGNGSDSFDGEVEVGPRWPKQKHGAHCLTPDEYYNLHGIGICLVGNLDNHPPTAKQTKSLRRLVHFLCVQFDIPSSRVFTHGGITGKTECPGSQFSLPSFRALVRHDGIP